MLIKNGKLVDLKEDKDFQRFKKNELPHLPNPLVIKSPRPVSINPTGLKEEMPAYNILLISAHESPEGLDEWAYTARLKRDKDSGDYIPDKKSELITGNIKSIQHKDADLIYFLLKKSRQLGNSFIVEDNVKDAIVRAEKKANEAELQALIYTSLSPLADEELLRNVAAAFGVDNAHTKPAPIVREDLENVIRKGEERKKHDKSAWGIDEFKDKINSTDEMLKRSIARRAVDNKVVYYHPESFFFRFKDNDDKILLVPKEQLSKREEYFVNQCMRDKELWAIIKKAIITPEMIDGWKDPKQYGWLAEEEGIPKTAKRDEKIAKLKEIYS
jgi:hypothetical protein